jgi:hypothetical protein
LNKRQDESDYGEFNNAIKEIMSSTPTTLSTIKISALEKEAKRVFD